MDIIVVYLKEGCIVFIDGLGNFYFSIISEVVDKLEECIVNKVWVFCICFKVVFVFLNNVWKIDFVSL